MGVQFIEQSSASSVGYTEKATKTRADPSLCFPGIFAGYGRGWATAAVHCCHPVCCGIPVMCSRLGGWRGCLGAPGAPQRGWELHGAARGCSRAEPDLPCCCSRRHCQGDCGAHRLQAVPHCAPPAAPRLVPAAGGDGRASAAARARQHSPESWRGDVWMAAALSTPGSRFTGGCESNQEAAGKFRHLQG